VDLPPQRRGIVRIGPATTIRSDPLGLLRREHAFDDVQELFVHPRTVTVPSTSAGLIRDLDGSATRRLVDADMSFHAIREYAPGDARRQIHWKSTAKTGRLMVRQYEESRRSRMAVVLGLSSAEYASDDEFELAVSAASSWRCGPCTTRATSTSSSVPRSRASCGVACAPSDTSPRAPARRARRLQRRRSPRRDDAVPEVCRLTAEANERLSVAVLVAGSGVPLAALRLATLAFRWMPRSSPSAATSARTRAHRRSVRSPS
jgi:hypothetical protein